jgi:hypothetical protein
MPSLNDAQFQLNRAGEHLEAFHAAFGEFLALDPYQAIGELDSSEPFKDLHLSIRHHPPDTLAQLIANFARDLRVSLDYLAWQLALLDTDDPRDSTEFPIYADRAVFRGRGLNRIKDIRNPGARREIIRVQPYRAGKDAHSHSLWVAHRLAKVSEHRTPPIISQGIRYSFPFGGDVRAALVVAGEFKDGDIIPGPNIPPAFQAVMDLKVEPVFTVIYEKAGGIISVDWLQSLYDFVRDRVFPRFERFFA